MKKLVAIAIAFALLASASPALALTFGSDIEVENSNSAYISNSVWTSALTGGNVIATGDGGASDSGKTVAVGGSNATGGAAVGGAGGENSGDITSGNAMASTKVTNDVNTNKTNIKACSGCFSFGKTEVENRSKARIGNEVTAGAGTGENGIGTGFGGTGDSCKTVAVGGSNATGGTAVGGAGGKNSGDIESGDALARTKVVNTVNTNITRIRR
jgi:hypothetical protein